jgi:hypothetical protein
VISNGDFDQYWRFHLGREHQRLYPGAAQGEYALGEPATASPAMALRKRSANPLMAR